MTNSATAHQILTYLENSIKDGRGKWVTTSRILKGLELHSNQRAGTLQKLHAMVETGQIGRHGKGKYRWCFNQMEIQPNKGDQNQQPQQPTGDAGLIATINDLKAELKAEKTEKEAVIESCRSSLEMMENQFKERLENAKNDGPQEIIIKQVNGEEYKLEGIVHRKFERILQLAQARKNIMLVGPTGSGKTHVCRQVAEALDLPFGFVSCTAGMSEGVLGGRLLPVGKSGRFSYVISQFVDCFENGGVFLLDEFDAADENVLLLINAALANNEMPIPNRPENPIAIKHPDFICIAAANTFGTGADRTYSGRNQLDAATLNRFQIGIVEMDYDERVERALCDDEELLVWCWEIRKNIRDSRLERTMSTRFILDAYKMRKEFKWSRAELKETLFAGWREDEIAKALQNTI